MGILNSMTSTVVETLASKTVGAVGDKIKKSWDQHQEYKMKLAALNVFCGRLIGLTEAQGKIKCAEQGGLRLRVMRRNEKDYSFGGKLEKAYDRVLVEIDNDKISRAYLG